MRNLALCITILLATLVQAKPSPAEEAAQDPSQPVGGLAFADEIDVTVVNVDVYVRDRSGRPVEGLGAGDFRILQDGEEMPITNFAAFDEEVIRHIVSETEIRSALQTTGDAGGEIDLPEVKPVWVVLYIDNENIEALDRNRVLRRVREFVAESLADPVRMMVVAYQRSLKVLQPFTTESREVTGALRGMVTVTGGREERESARRTLLRDMQDAKNQDYGSQVDTQSGAQAAMRQRVAAFAAEEANNLTFTIGGLRQVVGMMSGLDGRKSIIYVSSGLPMTPGIGLMTEYADIFHDQSILSLRGRYDSTRLFRELTSTANAQEVSLYSIDASGLNPLEGYEAENAYSRDPTASSIGSRNYQDSLRYMADATGGIAVINTNDVSGGLERITEDLFNYYSLGYQVGASGQDRVHRIEVELTGDKSYDIRYRQRFVEKSYESEVQDRVFTSLMVDVDENPMAVELEAGEVAPGTGDRFLASVHLSVSLEKVALMPEGDELVGRIVVFIGARDDEGRNSEVQRQDHEIRLPRAEYLAAGRERFGFDFTLLLEEGRHRIAVGVMDTITRQASFDRMVLTVP